MFIYKLKIVDGIVYTSKYRKFEFDFNLLVKTNLKRFIKKLYGSVHCDTSFLISVGCDGKPELMFILSEGFYNDKLHSKELYASSLLSRSDSLLILNFCFNSKYVNRKRLIEDYKKINLCYGLLELRLIDYYLIVDKVVYNIKKLEKSDQNE